MQNFTVYESPAPGADRIDRAEALVFVRDGFSWGAALFAPLWLLFNRMWRSLLGYVVLAAALHFLGVALRLDQHWTTLVNLGVNVLLGFEAQSLRRWELERSGWTFAGTVTGTDVADCERRFFEAWLPAQPILASRSSAMGLQPDARRGWRLGGLLGTR